MTDHSWDDGHPADTIVIRTSAITTASRPWILAGLVADAPAEPPPALVGVPGCGHAPLIITSCTWAA
ncbi:hypothetical protein [Nonomuraea sp. NPDC048826]|uniref:hypothetical protein n=1 Tax=Nonomuraea sp. NPDC048826 TaxID=3364347 RepID=UPI00370FB85D